MTDEPARIPTGERLWTLAWWMMFVGGLMAVHEGVVRKFPEVFAGFGVTIPDSTRAVIGFAAWSTRCWPIVLAIYVGVGFMIASTRSTLALKVVRRSTAIVAIFIPFIYLYALFVPVVVDLQIIKG